MAINEDSGTPMNLGELRKDTEFERLVELQLTVASALLSHMTPQEIADSLELHLDRDDLYDTFSAIVNLSVFKEWSNQE
jgi:hypothetical protein